MSCNIIGCGSDDSEYKESFTIGKLLEELENSTANSVRLIGTDYTLGTLMSWRGSYDIPAFDYDVGYKSPQQLAAEIRDDLKDIHQGYKGGDYMYTENDVFYLAPYGRVGGEHQVVDVKTEQSILYLCTKIVPY